MPNYKYPIKAENIVEVSSLEEANNLSENGYVILAVRVNNFIEDDDKFNTEFIYCLAKPEDIEETD